MWIGHHTQRPKQLRSRLRAEQTFHQQRFLSCALGTGFNWKMLLIRVSLMLMAFGLAQTLPIEEAETPPTGEVPDAGQVVFDQRQTGKFNIHVSIKDVAIIEVGQNGLAEETYNDEEDYYYDDSALTVKPIRLTTGSTSSTTTASTTSATLPESTVSTVATNTEATEHATSSTSKPKSRLNNLMIVETPIGGLPKPLHHQLHARSKHMPNLATASITPPTLREGIEYTPTKGHNSPIYKVKVQRSSMPASKKPARCRNHVMGKCIDSISAKLFDLVVGMNFPFLAAANAAEKAEKVMT
ncbi:uncharacterized protein LOC122614503 [Drosophila teissieri]|uniref:uncharacterized protein LOC122614503 n=1 Tax=Drosophila teissieri TaxID=7243 RepID=UPI001CB9DC99|nr:uncharacterized protein LOC122614503 [Drosophila teissieri]